MDDSLLYFEGYCLDPRNACVWRGPQALHLTAKAFTVLHTLVQQAGQLVTKDALFQAAWPDTAVSDAALTICIGEVRKALGETAQTPRFIATVHRRGYRFIASVSGSPTAVASGQTATTTGPERVMPPRSLAPSMVGYEAERARLHDCFEEARRGARQFVLVSGEAGIGKTTVVDAFLASLAPQTPCWVAWGQCLAHYGAGEAYLPVLDALGRLCREPEAARLLALLGQYAPTWLVQMPALCSPAALEGAQRQVQGATRERMLRELAEALEAVTVERPLVLVLEDLHWSDYATLDLLTWLARRREPARLLVLGTYRPVDVIVHGHPLQSVKQELALHRQCVELRLEGLSVAAVAAYLATRLLGGPLPAGLAEVLYRRTDGHSLFMVEVVDAWVRQGGVTEVAGQWEVPGGLAALETAVPESVRQLIEQQLDGCSVEEQRLLAAASVAGLAWSAAAVAAGMEAAVGQVEEQCAALVRRGQFLRVQGVETWPDGTVAGGYGFVHALHQQVVYERLPVGRRIELHRRIGLRQEAGYGERAHEHAAALAVHFAGGQDYRRAVQYLGQAAGNAAQRHAPHEVTALLIRGLGLLATLPETPARAQQELDLQMALGPALMATKGHTAPEVEHTYARASVLCQQLGDTPRLFLALLGLWRFYNTRGALQTAYDLGQQLHQLAQQAQESALYLEAHMALGGTLWWRGQPREAWRHLEPAIALYDSQQHRLLALRSGIDPGVVCRSYAAMALWVLGYPEQAMQQNAIALRLAQESGHPFSLGFALHFSSVLHQFRRDIAATCEGAEAVLAHSTEQVFPSWQTQGTILRGWALVGLGHGGEGLAQIRQGLTARQAMGANSARSHYLTLLAEVQGQLGQIEAGLTTLAEAWNVAEQYGEHFYRAELLRLRGELLWLSPASASLALMAKAEACLHQAIAIAQSQQARSWELRAALSLASLWQQQGKQAQAHELLAPIYGWFTEGFDTADLEEARTLLDACAS